MVIYDLDSIALSQYVSDICADTSFVNYLYGYTHRIN